MIAYLKGRIFRKSQETFIVDTGQIGYEVFCSTNTLNNFEMNSEISLEIYTLVREDALTLYGFSSYEEKEFFLELIKVNGVGPKLAIKILSGGSLSDIHLMIKNSDIQSLTKLPKVGKKIAEQIILTLKGKLKISPAVVNDFNYSHSEIISAIVHLGFRMVDVEKVVQKLDPKIEFEDGMRQALSILSEV